MEKVLFIDRDGRLIEEPADNQVDALEKVRLVQDVVPALISLRDAGSRFVMVTNQDGLGTESFPMEAFARCHGHDASIFESQGVTFDEVFICPLRESDGCACRKPNAGLLTRYLSATVLDTERSAVIGDRETDLQLAKNIGIRGLLVRPSD